MMHQVFRVCVFPRRAGSLLALAACLALLPLAGVAAQNQGLIVTPLEDDFGGGQRGDAPGISPTEGAGPSAPAGGGASAPGMVPGTGGAVYKDGLVMAYLVELMRKQDKACPSGTRPAPPPSLLFSEPLCRVAEAVAKGADFPASYAAQGIYAERWRMFSAGDLPPQRIATQLRAEHCEALLEPHTHIGAWKGPQGWTILLATLGKDPSATAPDGSGAGQEARALFQSLNDIRAKGGTCPGSKAARTAPPLVFDPILQGAAEKDAAAAASRGKGGAAAGKTGDAGSIAENYPGTRLVKLTATSVSSPSAAVATWMAEPSLCEAIVSPDIQDAGAAFADGYWIVLLGQPAKGGPVPTTPPSRQKK